jgi:WASH complex subunit 7
MVEQYLAKKFNVFSQFLFDDHIRSRLLQEVRAFKASKGAPGTHQYPLVGELN